ncbi:MAG: vanadium-dependent haloperoxidase, partial [Halalkalicoccus sp.]
QVLGGIGAAGLASVFGLGSAGVATANDGASEMMDRSARMDEVRETRMELVRRLRRDGMPSMEERDTVDDEDAVPSKVAMFRKGLPHAGDGTPDLDAYEHLVEALETGDPDLFESLPMGGHRKLIEPQGAYSVELMGADPHSLTIEAPPAFGSEEHVGEMVEVYWQSLARDVPFREYGESELIRAAADDLADAPGYDGPTDPNYLFHADLDGVERGPYLSQFLLKDAPLSVHEITQEIITLEPGVDYVTDYDEWLANMRGQLPGPEDESGHHDGELADSLTDYRKYMSTGRDLAACVERDMVFQPYMIAVMVLMGRPVDGVVSEPEKIYGDYHPYADSDTQVGFLNFGREGVMDLVSGIGQPAHVAAWAQKWLVHRRARPEAFGGLIEATANPDIDADHPVPVEAFEEYEVFDRLQEENGSRVLTQAYPEGCPLHPSYPGGHATVSGACSTVLKAVLNEDTVIEDPVQPTADGSALEPYEDEELTVGGELNKLTSNVNYGGRQFAGVHYRSDHDAGIRLGEQLAIGYLEDAAMRFHEEFDGWTFTNFDGETVTIG